jgi:hypothetical protein
MTRGCSSIAFVRLGLIVALASACGNASPYQRRQEYQQRQAQKLAAAELEPQQGAWRAMHRMRVRVHAAREYRDRDRDWRARFEEQVVRANRVLEQALAIKLEVVEAREWESAAGEDISAQREALIAHDRGDDVDWVVGLIGSTPRAEMSFRQLGEATVLGKHLVMRDMNDAEEQRVFGEAFDTLDDDERRRLYADRKRHKEAVILLHELGHTLGAIHVDEPADIMCSNYDNRMQTFAEANVVLMRRVLAYRRQPEGERDLPALIAALAAYVRETAEARWLEVERREYLTMLQEAAASLQQPAPAPAPGTAAAAASDGVAAAPVREGPEWDVSALPEPDRARFAQARADLDANKLAPAWQVLEPLAEQHVASYAVQHLACTLAMRGGVPIHRMRQYCDRMAALALEASQR